MTCNREVFLDGLSSYLTGRLVAVYGNGVDGLECTRDLSVNPQDINAEATPTIRLLEGTRRSAGNVEIPLFNLELKLVVIIRRQASTSALIMQTEGNEFEKNLDGWLFAVNTISGVHVSVFQSSGQQSTVYAGDSEVWIEYDTTLQYASEWS